MHCSRYSLEKWTSAQEGNTRLPCEVDSWNCCTQMHIGLVFSACTNLRCVMLLSGWVQAAANGHVECVKLLAEYGAAFQVSNAVFMTLVHRQHARRSQKMRAR